MINLIPNQEKKKKVRDFYFRLTTVTLFVFSLAVLIALVAMLPAYFLSSVKQNLAAEKLGSQSIEPVPLLDQKTQTIVDDLNSRLNLIEQAEENKYLVSVKIINEIMLKKMPDIKITQILYETEAKGLPAQAGKKISVRGIARSREELLLFRRALEDNIAFTKVDLPISNFVKGSNIQFSLILIPS
ncbi:hypothetical protein A2933_01045 [Candidatus Nomurabacteria bacterium RIFCSPLOWO2_01_FULL_46_18]|uniref:Uncharacterized protein n=1 Tax=Candidatus Nomurabacteria bacterium RIFCSPLOWO2_01_FULL_46_18 TaxID=1801783 RepID=A0A1F6XE63_9BACT|nr:MAG: hypothetical protein A2933_01045 [Candidatus Nomurabacteria bacterium RIFCSPLOWO2_01_FULL_46_18]